MSKIKIQWNRRASKIDDDLFGIGIKNKVYKSKCGKFMLVMCSYRGESERWTPYVLSTMLDGAVSFRHLHHDPTKTHRTRRAAQEVCLQYVPTPKRI